MAGLLHLATALPYHLSQQSICPAALPYHPFQQASCLAHRTSASRALPGSSGGLGAHGSHAAGASRSHLLPSALPPWPLERATWTALRGAPPPGAGAPQAAAPFQRVGHSPYGRRSSDQQAPFLPPGSREERSTPGVGASSPAPTLRVEPLLLHPDLHLPRVPRQQLISLCAASPLSLAQAAAAQRFAHVRATALQPIGPLSLPASQSPQLALRVCYSLRRVFEGPKRAARSETQVPYCDC
mmetsp:Transcript_40543/g.75983  ORF Transcript_40543/g.75983 Transcript_40543/m.75983 type:complete len:241 (+) Transcript_40543:90-812(+)